MYCSLLPDFGCNWPEFQVPAALSCQLEGLELELCTKLVHSPLRDLCRTGGKKNCERQWGLIPPGKKALQTQVKHVWIHRGCGTIPWPVHFKPDVQPAREEEPKSLTQSYLQLTTASKGKFSLFPMESHWIYKPHFRGNHEQPLMANRKQTQLSFGNMLPHNALFGHYLP